MTVHKVAPPAAAGWNEIDARTQFATGKAAMAFAGSWQQAAIKKDNPEIEKVWGTFPIPGPDGKPAPAFAGGSDIAIWEDSERQDLAWDYLTVLLNKKNNAEAAPTASSFFPVYQDLVGGGAYAMTRSWRRSRPPCRAPSSRRSPRSGSRSAGPRR